MTVSLTKPFKATLAKWTLEEYHRMIESGVLDDRQVELIRGEIIETAPEGKSQTYASTESGNYLVLRFTLRSIFANTGLSTLKDKF